LTEENADPDAFFWLSLTEEILLFASFVAVFIEFFVNLTFSFIAVFAESFAAFILAVVESSVFFTDFKGLKDEK
jgi:hypothetical protein